MAKTKKFKNRGGGATLEKNHGYATSRQNWDYDESTSSYKPFDGEENWRYASTNQHPDYPMLNVYYTDSQPIGRQYGSVAKRKNFHTINKQYDRLAGAIMDEAMNLIMKQRDGEQLTAEEAKRLNTLNKRLDKISSTHAAFNEYHKLGAKGGSNG